MMLDPVSERAPEGVRVHIGAANVQDQTVRGETTAERTDQLKYIFEKAGQFTIPDLEFVWWDPHPEELRTETIPGGTVRVVPPPVAEQPSADAAKPAFLAPRYLILGLLALAFCGWSLRKLTHHMVAAWQTKRDQPESRAARQLRRLCGE